MDMGMKIRKQSGFLALVRIIIQRKDTHRLSDSINDTSSNDISDETRKKIRTFRQKHFNKWVGSIVWLYCEASQTIDYFTSIKEANN